MTAVPTLADVKLLTVAEVAAAMRVSPMSVYRFIEAGDLPALRFGAVLRISEQALRDYLVRSETDHR